MGFVDFGICCGESDIFDWRRRRVWGDLWWDWDVIVV